MTNLVALAEGTVLVGDYRIERVLGAGGFGITYLATEIPLARLVTIKEYFPIDFAARAPNDEVCPRSLDCATDYSWGLDRFLSEAQTLARFNHPNIVRVYRYFRDRNSGYIVLHFEEGQSFKGWLKSLGRAPRQPELDRVVPPLLDALETIHAQDFLHRDIAPDNIIVRTDGSPVLIDFGSARAEVAKHSKTVSALVKPGYSPYEQYATDGRKQGPWTDIYSLGATLYQAISGKRPPDAPTRMVMDGYRPASEAALSSYRPGFLAGIDRALALDMTRRPRTVADWRAELMAPPPKRASPRQLFSATPPSPPVSDPVAPPPPAAAQSVPVPLPPHVAAMARPVAETAKPGIVGEFMRGWRRSETRPPTPLHPPQPQSVAPPVAARPVESPAAPPPALSASERRAPPRALRARYRPRWKSLAVKLMLGLGIAGAAVYWTNDRAPPAAPKPEAKGEQTVLAQSGETVPVGQLKGHRGAVTGVAYSGDGRLIVTSAEDARLKVWNAATRANTATIELDNGAATSLSVEGRRAVTGHRDGTVAIWDLESGQKVASLKRNSTGIVSAGFIGDGARVAAGAQDGVVALWDTNSPAAPQAVLDGHDGAVQGLAFTPKGGLLATAGADKTLRLWTLSGPTLTRVYKGHGEAVEAIAVTADGKKLASASADGQIRISSTQSSRTHYTMRVAVGRILGLAFSPDGELLASVGEDGQIRIWDVKRGRILRTLQAHTGGLRTVAFSPDGRRIAAAGTDGLVRLWDGSVIKP